MQSSKKIRERLVNWLNSILKVPKIFIMCESDLELRLRELIYDLCYIDEMEIEGDPIIEELIAYGMYYPANVIDGVSKRRMNKKGKFPNRYSLARVCGCFSSDQGYRTMN